MPTNQAGLAIAELAQIAQDLADRLDIPTPSVAAAAAPLETPARCSAADMPCGEIEFDSAFLDQFSRDDEACWIVLAHEVGHLYWDQRVDLASGLPGFGWEDGADFTAGQLAASFGRNPVSARIALRRVLAAYDGLHASGFHRDIEDRENVFSSGYALWARERTFR